MTFLHITPKHVINVAHIVEIEEIGKALVRVTITDGSNFMVYTDYLALLKTIGHHILNEPKTKN